ncbi:MAG: bacillithiol system redox-active protein YtxJ [Gemmatimonadaceae bacterium]
MDIPRLTEQDLPDLLTSDRATIVFKHSPYCVISTHAATEVARFMLDAPDARVKLVDVIAQRPLSQQLAGTFRVPHASPQVLLVRGGIAHWHRSHSQITAVALADATAETLGSGPQA